MPSMNIFVDINSLPSQPLTNPHAHILSALDDLARHYPPTYKPPSAHHGLYYGPTSIAYLFLRLSTIYPDLVIAGRSCRELCSLYLEVQPTGTTSTRPGRCGIGDETLAYMTVKACLRKSGDLAMAICSEELLEIILQDEDEEGSDEWLYGRAGYLYYLRMIRAFFPKEGTEFGMLHDMVDIAVQRTVERILKSPRPWKWHGKRYLGAVHGAMGIITQIILSSPSHAKVLQKEVEGILEAQLENGNWDSSIERAGTEPAHHHHHQKHPSDRLVQTCHGAPGIVVSLLSISRYYPLDHPLHLRINAAIRRARTRAIIPRGFLTKEPCLCHGATGNALALEKDDMLLFLGYTTPEKVAEGFKTGVFVRKEDGDGGTLDERMGLWTGAAGRVWGFIIAEMLGGGGSWEKRREWEGRLVGYNDL